MDRLQSAQVEVTAAKMLVGWTSEFAENVHREARRLAAQSGQPQRITASQYRHAAVTALQSLRETVEAEVDRDDRQTAA
jgi:hypothetical protein